jgi:hypothetical protein
VTTDDPCFAVLRDELRERRRVLAVGRLDDESGMGVVEGPVVLHGTGVVVRDGDVHRDRLVVLRGEGVVERLRDGLLQLADEDDRDVPGRAEVHVVVHLDLVLDVAVVPVHADHEERQHGDREEDEPGAVRELRDRHDHEHDDGEGRAERVDEQTRPRLGARRPPWARAAAARAASASPCRSGRARTTRRRR